MAKQDPPTYIVRDVEGWQRNCYTITSLHPLITLYEGAMDYFEEERSRMLREEGVEDDGGGYGFRFKDRRRGEWFGLCLKYRQHYFLRAQKLLSMLPEPPNKDKKF